METDNSLQLPTFIFNSDGNWRGARPRTCMDVGRSIKRKVRIWWKERIEVLTKLSTE